MKTYISENTAIVKFDFLVVTGAPAININSATELVNVTYCCGSTTTTIYDSSYYTDTVSDASFVSWETLSINSETKIVPVVTYTENTAFVSSLGVFTSWTQNTTSDAISINQPEQGGEFQEVYTTAITVFAECENNDVIYIGSAGKIMQTNSTTSSFSTSFAGFSTAWTENGGLALEPYVPKTHTIDFPQYQQINSTTETIIDGIIPAQTTVKFFYDNQGTSSTDEVGTTFPWNLTENTITTGSVEVNDGYQNTLTINDDSFYYGAECLNGGIISFSYSLKALATTGSSVGSSLVVIPQSQWNNTITTITGADAVVNNQFITKIDYLGNSQVAGVTDYVSSYVDVFPDVIGVFANNDAQNSSFFSPSAMPFPMLENYYTAAQVPLALSNNNEIAISANNSVFSCFQFYPYWETYPYLCPIISEGIVTAPLFDTSELSFSYLFTDKSNDAYNIIGSFPGIPLPYESLFLINPIGNISWKFSSYYNEGITNNVSTTQETTTGTSTTSESGTIDFSFGISSGKNITNQWRQGGTCCGGFLYENPITVVAPQSGCINITKNNTNGEISFYSSSVVAGDIIASLGEIIIANYNIYFSDISIPVDIPAYAMCTFQN